MQGKIIKGIAGFYYVYTKELGLLECKAKGIFRKDKRKPLVGDNVCVELISREDRTGNITEIQQRDNALIRPAVANVDQAVVIFAAARPKPNFHLLDRFLLMMEYQHVRTAVCFNKTDAVTEDELKEIGRIYSDCGYQILFTSAKEEKGLEELLAVLKNKTTVVAGPSGVGKSSLVNLMQQDTRMETGDISEKIGRGRHTTRHSQMIPIDGDSFILDTPGFSSLYVPDMEETSLQSCFPEFSRYEPECRFQGCLHVMEPDCGVKRALAEGKISASRYENYRQILEELKTRKKY